MALPLICHLAISALLSASFRGVLADPLQVGDPVSWIYYDISHAQAHVTVNVHRDIFAAALSSPNMTDSDTFPGYDFTQPYEDAVPLDGFTARLRIAADVPLPDAGGDKFKDKVSTVTSVAVSVPDRIAAENGTGGPAAIDPSWRIFSGYYYLPMEMPANATDCGGVLAQECMTELAANFSSQFSPNREYLFPVELPGKCRPGSESDGYGEWIHTDTIDAFRNSPKFVFTQNLPLNAEGINIGTGYNDRGNNSAYDASGRQTILIATIWGYSNMTGLTRETAALPNVTMSCVNGARGIAQGSRELGAGSTASVRWVTLLGAVAFAMAVLA